MRLLFTILLALLASSGIFAQSRFTGRVTDAKGTVLAGANIIIKSPEGKMLKYTITDSEGCFAIETDSRDNILEASMMGFRKEVITLKDENYVAVVLNEENFQLKEVTVKAEKIKEAGDTVTYLVSSFSQEQDRTIGDVFRRLPGIDVSEGGKIQYQGVDINKFYIEGHDLMGGKYGLATNGISADDVGSVEIIENHQPKQVLQNLMFSEQAAVNLRLKNSSKAAWIVNTELKGGFTDQPKGVLWNGELLLMKIKPSFQTLSTLKSNNTGDDLTGEITDHLLKESTVSHEPYISLSFPSLPQLERKRTLINRSTLLSSNSLWSKGNKELSLRMSYLNDRQESQLSTAMTYILPGTQKEVIENKNTVEHRDFLDTFLNYEVNQKNNYLKNDFRAQLAFDRQSLSVNGSLSNTQAAKSPWYRLSNNMEWIHKFGNNRLVSFFSLNNWESQPQRLTVISDGENLRQVVNEHSFHSEEKVQYAVRIGRFRISGNGGFSVYFRQMSSLLNNAFTMQGLTENANDLSTNNLSLFVSPEVEYSHRGFSLQLHSPINYSYYTFADVIEDKSRVVLSPQVTLRWSPNGRITVSATGSMADTPMSIKDIHQGYIASDYRTLFQGVDRFYSSSNKRLTLRLSYKQVSAGFFSNFFISRTWNSTPYKLSQQLMDEYVIYTYQNSMSNSNGINGILTFSKTLDFMKGGAGVTASYMDNRRSMLTENVSSEFNNSTKGVYANLYGSILSWLNWAYDWRYNHTTMKISGRGKTGLQHVSHSFSLTALSRKRMMLELSGEYYRDEIEPSRFKDMFLMDSKLTWHLSSRADLTAGINNLLNKKSYQLTTFGNMVTTQRIYRLRGREFWVSVYIKKK